MKKYLVQVTSKGTESNPNFAGVIDTYVCGKGSLSNIDRTVRYDDYPIIEPIIKRLAKDYGYATESAAKVGLAALKKSHDEEAARYGFHTFEHEIVCASI
jgi:hypothetical protein